MYGNYWNTCFILPVRIINYWKTEAETCHLYISHCTPWWIWKHNWDLIERQRRWALPLNSRQLCLYLADQPQETAWLQLPAEVGGGYFPWGSTETLSHIWSTKIPSSFLSLWLQRVCLNAWLPQKPTLRTRLWVGAFYLGGDLRSTSRERRSEMRREGRFWSWGQAELSPARETLGDRMDHASEFSLSRD